MSEARVKALVKELQGIKDDMLGVENKENKAKPKDDFFGTKQQVFLLLSFCYCCCCLSLLLLLLLFFFFWL